MYFNCKTLFCRNVLDCILMYIISKNTLKVMCFKILAQLSCKMQMYNKVEYICVCIHIFIFPIN